MRPIFISLALVACGDVSLTEKDDPDAETPTPTDTSPPVPADSGEPNAGDTAGSVSTDTAIDTGREDTGEPDTADLDGDGYSVSEGDCNDLDSSRHPGRDEVCDGIDNNCDGDVDEDAMVTWYLDFDGDGHGSSSFTYDGCEPLEGYVASSDDCNDTSDLAYPGALETCDELDNNCNGVIDEGVTTVFFVDSDGDGYGDAGLTVAACTVPPGYSANDLDCNDLDRDVSPAGLEVCDGIDNDCDDATDEGDAVGATTYFRDADADGFGTASESTTSCMVPAGFVANAMDCDDHDNDIYPDAPEVCDGEDNDCDDLIDEEGAVMFADTDGDGFGDPLTRLLTCDSPAGYVMLDTDCDDRDADVSPAAVEVCDSIDNNCDGSIDGPDASDASIFYVDADGDGFGLDDTTTAACALPEGYATVPGDCDDDDPGVSPGAEEIRADGIDQDCDGEDYVVPEHTGSEEGWYHANYFGEYTTFNPTTYYGSGSISCPDTCAHYGLTARGARFVCNQYTGGSGEGCYPWNDGMYGEANCGLMVRDMVVLTENGNTEDCAGGIMGCVTGSCSEGVTWHSVECQCE